MTDVHSKEIRSYNMSRIRNKDTNPELIVRRHLHKNGFRYRLNSISLPGKPDIVLRKFKTCIFVHGCFWHGHDDCKYYKIPKTRRQWWKKKIYDTKFRDRKNIEDLSSSGWNIIVIWECELLKNCRELTLKNLIENLEKNNENSSN